MVELEYDGEHEESKTVDSEQTAGYCETDLSCKMVSASRSECALVASMGDGTCSQVEYRGLDFISMCGCLSIIQ